MSVRTWLSGRRELAALSIGSAVGYIGAVIIPFWAAALPASGALSQAATGQMASGEMLATAAANVAVSAVSHKLDPRRAVAASAMLAAAGNLLAAFGPDPAGLVVGRLCSGIGLGALLAMVTAAAARQARPQHVLSTLQFTLLPFLAVVALVSPSLILIGSTRLLFGLVAVCAIGAAAAGAWFPAGQGSAWAAPSASRVETSWAAPAMAGLAVAAFFAAQSTVTTYLVSLGGRAGFGLQSVGVLISLTLILNLAAPIGARWLGERTGLLKPILGAGVLLMFNVLAIAAAPFPAAFALGLLILYLAPVFILPYQFGFLARLDPSGRCAAAGPAFVMFGGAAGPAVGAPIIAHGAPAGLGVAAAALLAASLVGFVIAARMGSDHAETQALAVRNGA